MHAPGNAEGVLRLLGQEASSEAARGVGDAEEGDEDIVAIYLAAQALDQLPCRKGAQIVIIIVRFCIAFCRNKNGRYPEPSSKVLVSRSSCSVGVAIWPRPPNGCSCRHPSNAERCCASFEDKQNAGGIGAFGKNIAGAMAILVQRWHHRNDQASQQQTLRGVTDTRAGALTSVFLWPAYERHLLACSAWRAAHRDC